MTMYLSDILATELLGVRRRDRGTQAPPVPAAPADDTLAAIRARCERAMAQCGAQSAGVSIFDSHTHDELVWIATAGQMRAHEGKRFELRNSMCGICFEYRAPQLFLKPHHYFPWMQAAHIAVAEALVAPLFGPFGGLYGTLWVMTHDGDTPHFDAQDVHTLNELGKGLYSKIWAHDAARALSGKNPESN